MPFPGAPERSEYGCRVAGVSGEQLGFDSISDEMPVELVRVTPARLATWERCPRRYRMAYVDRPTPPRGGAWAHSTLGASVHNALRAYFELPVARRTPDAAAALVVRHWKDEGFSGSEQSCRYRDRAARWVCDYVASLEDGFTPVAVERRVSAAVGAIIAEGRVDRIDERDGELVIVDYKTGRRTPTVDDAAASPALALYALAAARSLRRRCRLVELHHLPSGTVAAARHDEHSLAAHREGAERAAREFTSATDRLAAGDAADAVFPPVTGAHCATCDFRRNCPEGQAAAPERPAWAMLAP